MLGEVSEEGDSLRIPDPYRIPGSCSELIYQPVFEAVFKVVAPASSPGEELRTAVIVTNDSLTFNGFGVKVPIVSHEKCGNATDKSGGL